MDELELEGADDATGDAHARRVVAKGEIDVATAP